MKIKNTLSRYLIISIVSAMVYFSSSSQLLAQDVRLSQPFTNVLGLNPAMMGPNSDMKVSINHRSQWASVNDGYKTYNLNFLYPIFLKEGNSKLDLGLGIQNRTYGAFDNLNFNLSVGYKLKLSDNGHHLSAAIQGGYVQNGLNASDLTFDDQYSSGSFNPTGSSQENISNETVSYIDAGVGLMWFYNPLPEMGKVHAYFGISLYHLNQPDESFTSSASSLPLRQSFQLGVKLITESKLIFTPHVFVHSQGGAEEVSTGLYVDYLIDEDFTATLAGWYRKDNAIALLLGLKWRDFGVGYSYDIITSQLNTSTGGVTTHEISLTYGFDLAAKKELEIQPSPLGLY